MIDLAWLLHGVKAGFTRLFWGLIRTVQYEILHAHGIKVSICTEQGFRVFQCFTVGCDIYCKIKTNWHILDENYC